MDGPGKARPASYTGILVLATAGAAGGLGGTDAARHTATQSDCSAEDQLNGRIA
jgi:hypothetical protein